MAKKTVKKATKKAAKKYTLQLDEEMLARLSQTIGKSIMQQWFSFGKDLAKLVEDRLDVLEEDIAKIKERLDVIEKWQKEMPATDKALRKIIDEETRLGE